MVLKTKILSNTHTLPVSKKYDFFIIDTQMTFKTNNTNPTLVSTSFTWILEEEREEMTPMLPLKMILYGYPKMGITSI